MEKAFVLKHIETILKYIDIFKPLPYELVDLTQAWGRTLAQNFYAPEDIPPRARATRDGFAIRAVDTQAASSTNLVKLQLIAECPMGALPNFCLHAGEVARIGTGGILPAGADAVVMKEYALVEDGALTPEQRVVLNRHISSGAHVVHAGEDAAAGQLLIPAGQVLRAQDVGLLAACGESLVEVRQKPVVGIIPTGDELCSVGSQPLPGQVRNSNAFLLAALVEKAGASAQILNIVGDCQEALQHEVQTGLRACHSILISGGSSDGRRDHTWEALQALPNCDLFNHEVHISSGRPLALARFGEKTVWGLPGHALGLLMSAELFIVPLLQQLSGQSPALKPSDEHPEFAPLTLCAHMGADINSALGSRDAVCVAVARSCPICAPTQTLPVAHPITRGTGLINILRVASGYVLCPEAEAGLTAGQQVDVHIFG